MEAHLGVFDVQSAHMIFWDDRNNASSYSTYFYISLSFSINLNSNNN